MIIALRKAARLAHVIYRGHPTACTVALAYLVIVIFGITVIFLDTSDTHEEPV